MLRQIVYFKTILFSNQPASKTIKKKVFLAYSFQK